MQCTELTRIFFQVVIKKESSYIYDAGIAVDDVTFISCPLERPTIDAECPPGGWRCQNQVGQCSTLGVPAFSKFWRENSESPKVLSLIHI